MFNKINRRNFLSKLSLTTLMSLIAKPVFAIPRTMKELVEMEDNLTETGLLHGNIPSINKPEYMNVGAAASAMDDNDVVFIYSYPHAPTEYYIIPQNIMVWHEVLNTVVKSNAYCLTYSPISATVVFYHATLGRTNLIFDSYGPLYDNNTVLIDRNTGSLWSQMLGMCFSGDYIGKGLNLLPVYWSTWKRAKTVFPDAQVLAKPQGSGRAYGRDPYGSFLRNDTYYQSEEIFYNLKHFDERLPSKTIIYGIEKYGVVAAIDIEYVKKRKVVNFYCGPLALVAFHDIALDTIRVYNREFWESRTPALFNYRNGYFEDLMTRSKWDIHGKCYEGNLENVQLDQFIGMYSFWFAFASQNPEALIVPGDTVVPDSALELGI